MKKNFIALFAFLLCGSTHAALGANLVTNGSFEQGLGGLGSFIGWQTTLGDSATFVDSSGQTGSRAGQSSDGLWSAYFGSSQASGGSAISQALATVANQPYLLTFDVAIDNGGGAAVNLFTAAVGSGVPILSLVNTSNSNYIREQFVFTAAAASTLLRFSAYNDNGYTQLDNVAVNAVPEPASIALCTAAVLLALVSGRYRSLRITNR